jgi:hypothetical protein
MPPRPLENSGVFPKADGFLNDDAPGTAGAPAFFSSSLKKFITASGSLSLNQPL